METLKKTTYNVRGPKTKSKLERIVVSINLVSLLRHGRPRNFSSAVIMSSSSGIFNIGVDFGGVLSAKDTEGAEHINTAIDMPFAVDNLLKLKALGHKLFLISFCGKARAIETKRSLETTNITEDMTCIALFDDIFFVKDKSFKRQMCEYLNCHFMVDDREDIQFDVQNSSCKTIPILFGQRKHSSLVPAYDWNVVSNIITSTPHFTIELAIDKPTKLLHNV